MNSRYLWLLCVFLVLNSCSSVSDEIYGIQSEINLDEEAREAASEFCDCALNAGYKPEAMVGELNFNYSRLHIYFQDCLQHLSDQYLIPKRTDGAAQKKFFKHFLHALIESKCMQKTLDAVPAYFFDYLVDYLPISY
ncbi:MAG: hypothetical protein R2799_02065 [Crocinitomicaceae bacterium]